MPTALTSKSSNGREAARSWLGWAAVWTIASGRNSSISLQHAGAVADVQLVVREAGVQVALQPPLVPAGIAAGAEEIGPHVVVHAVDVPAQGVEMRDHLRADQSAGTGHQESHGNLAV